MSRKKARAEVKDEVVKIENTTNNQIDTSMSNYERIRIENIRRNSEFLENLGLDDVKPDTDEFNTYVRKASNRGIRKEAKQTAVPVRRSGRVTVERVRAELEEARKGNNIELVKVKETELEALSATKFENSYEAALDSSYASEVMKRYSGLPITMLAPYNKVEQESSDTIVDEDVAYGEPLLASLRAISSDSCYGMPGGGTKTAVALKSFDQYIADLSKLSIQEDRVAKVVQSRITGMLVHPTVEKVIVVAGDKNGFIGIWDVDSGESGGNDNVYLYRPHVSNVTALHCWPTEPQKIWSVSYDGTIRYTDTNSSLSGFYLGFEAPEDINDIMFSDASFHKDGNTILVGKSDGICSLVDTRVSTTAYCYQFKAQQSKVNSVQYVPNNDNIVVTAGSGQAGGIAVHDIRQISKSSTKELRFFKAHSKSINAAYVSPDSQYIVSVGLDNTLKCHSNFQSTPLTTSIHHDNHTGRWLSTLKPTFDPKQPHAFVLGSMERPRRMEVFNITSATGVLSMVSTLKGDSLGSVCSRNAVHPTRNIVCGGNSSGRVHIFK